MTNDILTADLKEYADNIIERFEELEVPASITVFIETDNKILQSCSLRRGDTNSIIVNTFIRDIKDLSNNVEFLQALQKAINK